MSNKEAQRSCVACRRCDDQAKFIRIVATLDGRFGINPGNKIHGRSAYLCKNLKCYDLATKKHLLQRALKRPVPEKIIKELKEIILDNNNEEEVSELV